VKLKTDLQKLYAELLGQIALAKKDVHCDICGHEKAKHKQISTEDSTDSYSRPLFVCEGGEACPCERFHQNEMYLHDLELRASVLQWVLDQEDTVLEIDDCIMPETEIANTHTVGVESIGGEILVGSINEPYKTILLESSNKLPIILPGPANDIVTVATYAVMPNGSVHRTVKTVPEKEYIRRER
jgi:hypothetical protein